MDRQPIRPETTRLPPAVIYVRILRRQLSAGLASRADLWLGLVGAGLEQASALVFIVALFYNVSDLAGWTSVEVILLFGLMMLPRGIIELIFDGPWALRNVLAAGDFDHFLLRPMSLVLQVGSQTVSLHGFASIALGSGLTAFGLLTGVDRWTVGRAAYLPISIISSILIIGATNLVLNLIAFWELSPSSAVSTMLARTADFARFPLNIYDHFIQVLLTVALPFAFVSYFPALILLGKPSPWIWVGYLAPVAAGLALLFSAAAWRRALRQYLRSSG